MTPCDMTRATLHSAYRNRDLTPEGLIDELLARPADTAWIRRLTRDEVQPWLDGLTGLSPDTAPLYGLPFAIKDNIDLAGVPTSAGCPEFAYTPSASAFVVQQLVAAGAIPLGKTNLDQFATGLVGERALDVYGTPDNSFDADTIPGGSSSGSAVTTARGEASFALGTDTAGSGRVPACYNNLFGLKPTRGLLSNRGVVPACATLDTISIFALTVDDAHAVFDAAAAYDPVCPWSREHHFAVNGQTYGAPPAGFVFGVPRCDQWQTDPYYTAAMNAAITAVEAIGGRAAEVDCTPMLEAAKLLYGGPWVAERYHAIQTLIESQPEALHPVTRAIIENGARPSALDAFDAQYRLAEYKRQADQALVGIDFMIAPTTVTHPTKADVAAEPTAVNSRLGTWTNFMNLLDYSALAVPVEINDAGRPIGVTLFGRAFDDLQLLGYGRALESRLDLPLGATGHRRPVMQALLTAGNASLDIVVCGAHLEGLPLNHQLTERGGRLVTADKTARAYRLYALTEATPPRPALVRDDRVGDAIGVEIWRLPVSSVGSFLAGIPAPLGLGQLELEDGRWRTGFICAADTLEGRPGLYEITTYGSWREWLGTQSIDHNDSGS